VSKIIGIDLGTTNSVVAVMEGASPTVIINSEGGRLTPSVVAFTESGERLVGQVAKRQAITNPLNTIHSIKRFMGRRRQEVRVEEKMVPYQIVGEPNGFVRVRVPREAREFTPAEISAMVLQKLKQTAEDYLGEPVTAAVITVPAYFNDSQRQATKDAGQVAGLAVERIFNEPTAAALAYGLEKKKDQRIAVFDLGGGTFDISILEVGEGVFEVLATNGDTHLGGDDFDQALIDYVADDFQAKYGIDLRRNPVALQRLKEECERAKCELSTAIETDINLPFIAADREGPKHLLFRITRARFQQLTDRLVQRTRQPCLQAMRDAGMKPADIDEVILVGGASRMPAIPDIVREIFQREPNRSVNPDEVVAVGAAIQAAVLAGEVRDVLLLDVTPLSLGIETLGGLTNRLIERNTTIPTRHREVFTTSMDNQVGVDILVVQGEREMAADNRTLGKFTLMGIPPAARGVPQIEVIFDIDANGILNVSAKDLGSGKEQSIRIHSASGLSKEEIARMQKEAADQAVMDKQKRMMADQRNLADHILYTTERMLEAHGAKIGEAQREAIAGAVKRLREARESNNMETLKRAIEDLGVVSRNLAAIAYTEGIGRPAAPSDAPPSVAQPAPLTPEEPVVDAEFQEKEKRGQATSDQ
jgi:molecular chaperone DnaK